jgi:hypothetical protein
MIILLAKKFKVFMALEVVQIRAEVPDNISIPIFDKIKEISIASLALKVFSSYGHIFSLKGFGALVVSVSFSSILTTVVSNIFLNLFKMGVKAVYRHYCQEIELNKILDAEYSRCLNSTAAKVFKVFVLVISSQTFAASALAILGMGALSALIVSLPPIIDLLINSPLTIRNNAQSLIRNGRELLGELRFLNGQRDLQRQNIIKIDQGIDLLLRLKQEHYIKFVNDVFSRFGFMFLYALLHGITYFYAGETIDNVISLLLIIYQVKFFRDYSITTKEIGKEEAYLNEQRQINQRVLPTIERLIGENTRALEMIEKSLKEVDIWPNIHQLPMINLPGQPIVQPLNLENLSLIQNLLQNIDNGSEFLNNVINGYLSDNSVPQEEKNEFLENFRDLDADLFEKIARLAILKMLFSKEENPAFNYPIASNKENFENLQISFHRLSREQKEEVKRQILSGVAPQAHNIKTVWMEIRAKAYQIIQGNQIFLNQIQRARETRFIGN